MRHTNESKNYGRLLPLGAANCHTILYSVLLVARFFSLASSSLFFFVVVCVFVLSFARFIFHPFWAFFFPFWHPVTHATPYISICLVTSAIVHLLFSPALFMHTVPGAVAFISPAWETAWVKKRIGIFRWEIYRTEHGRYASYPGLSTWGLGTGNRSNNIIRGIFNFSRYLRSPDSENLALLILNYLCRIRRHRARGFYSPFCVRIISYMNSIKRIKI